MTEHRVPKICGADVELGNFIAGEPGLSGSGALAARALLREFDGVDWRRVYLARGCNCPVCRERAGRGASGARDLASNAGVSDAQDWGRKFLPANGGCVYIDLDHLEICLPEVASAFDYVAAWHAMLRLTRKVMCRANARREPDGPITVLVNNSDGCGNSYGAHLNMLISRRAWDNIFTRKMHYLLYLAAFQASSIVITGQGKVGSENGMPPADFQISQRADFLETLTGVQTTFRRPIVNSRDEPLCGNGYEDEHATVSDLARLHVIFYDSTLSHVATLLKVGTFQIVTAMIEAGRVNARLALEDPLEAVALWSRDPNLSECARTIDGLDVTAVDLQVRFLEEARRFVDDGGCEGLVPRAGEILDVWQDTLTKLHDGDLDALSRRLDWVLKLRVLEGVRHRHRLDWRSPQLKHLDHLFSSLDDRDGLYWQYEARGLTDPVATAADIAHFETEPPSDTRAWTRAMLLRACADSIELVDWDRVAIRPIVERGWEPRRTVWLLDPSGSTRDEREHAFTAPSDVDLLDALDATTFGIRGGVQLAGSSENLAREWTRAPRDAPTRSPFRVTQTGS
ncbi:MAG: proteasome accessory factor PafA2 family protein [Acidobacteria bacterium]|nr:proteasome accessory factor PafA2 family protein [Acidobacteriota bacterium]